MKPKSNLMEDLFKIFQNDTDILNLIYIICWEFCWKDGEIAAGRPLAAWNATALQGLLGMTPSWPWPLPSLPWDPPLVTPLRILSLDAPWLGGLSSRKPQPILQLGCSLQHKLSDDHLLTISLPSGLWENYTNWYQLPEGTNLGWIISFTSFTYCLFIPLPFLAKPVPHHFRKIYLCCTRLSRLKTT